MATNRDTDARLTPGAQCAATCGEQALDEEALKRQEQEAARREKALRPDPAPRAGRTGLGARAERPSEGRQPAEQGASGPRGGKPPAPRAHCLHERAGS